jgi:hypothetical protein
MDFVVYWIPFRSLNFHPYSFQKEKLPPVNVDDTGEWRVNISYKHKEGKYGKIYIDDDSSRLVVLEIVDFTRAGFLLCKVEFCHHSIQDKLINTFYHHIKEIWHSHEFHSSDEDTLLEAFFVTAEYPLLQFNKPLLKRSFKHYLSKYRLKFLTLSDKYSSISVEKGFFSYLLEPLKVNRYAFYSKEVENLEKALGEYLYFSNLKGEVRLLNLTDNEIEKLITEVDNFKDFLTFKMEEFKHRKEIIVSGWTFIALVIGLVALFLTL